MCREEMTFVRNFLILSLIIIVFMALESIMAILIILHQAMETKINITLMWNI